MLRGCWMSNRLPNVAWEEEKNSHLESVLYNEKRRLTHLSFDDLEVSLCFQNMCGYSI